MYSCSIIGTGLKETEIVMMEKPGAPGLLFISMDHFEAYLVVRLPRRSTKVFIDMIKITRMDNLQVEVSNRPTHL